MKPKNIGNFSCCIASEFGSESAVETSQEEGKMGRRNSTETGRPGGGQRAAGKRAAEASGIPFSRWRKTAGPASKDRYFLFFAASLFVFIIFTVLISIYKVVPLKSDFAKNVNLISAKISRTIN